MCNQDLFEFKWLDRSVGILDSIHRININSEMIEKEAKNHHKKACKFIQTVFSLLGLLVSVHVHLLSSAYASI